MKSYRKLSYAIACLAMLGVTFLLVTLHNSSNSLGTITSNKPSSLTTTSNNPLSGSKLFINPDSDAARQVSIWRTSKPEQAAAMSKLAAQPTATWFTSNKSLDTLPSILQAAKDQSAVPLLVTYNIPFRDCGKYSAGGAEDYQAYTRFIDNLVALIDDAPAIIIVEPDAIAITEARSDSGEACLTKDQRMLYFKALRHAIESLKSLPATTVYLDAGNSAWTKDAAKIARALLESGVGKADGFSLNVSNFQTTKDSLKYGKTLSQRLENKHFVVDTSRNGLGAYDNPTYPDFNWCNPPNRGLGHYPTVETGHALIDAYLYIKVPGESDGKDANPEKCFDGPEAGQWWPEYALGLVGNWPQELQPR